MNDRSPTKSQQDANTLNEAGDGEHRPAGYCPHCEYAIDPGVCPECGADVAAEKLDRVPKSSRRRRWGRPMAVSIMIAVVAIVGNRVYRTGEWITWIPSGILLATDVRNAKASSELLRRQMAGTLTEEQVEQMIRRCFSISTFVRSPRPAADSISLEVHVSSLIPTPSLNWQCHEPRVTIDESGDATVVPTTSGNLFDRFTYSLDRRLAPGLHAISGRVDVTFQQISLTRPKPIGAPVTISTKFHLEFDVEGRPWNSFVTPKYDNTMADDEGELCKLAICANRVPDYQLRLCRTVVGVPLAGWLEMRPKGSDEAIVTMAVRDPGQSQRSEMVADFTLPADLLPDQASFDIRFTPDLEIAFEEGFDACFGGVMEWHDVTLAEFDLPIRIGCSSCQPPFDRRPDVVRKWTPTE